MIFDFSGGKLEFFKALYEEARSAYAEEVELFRRRRAQYLGDNAIDGSPCPATHVRNITYELIESQVTGYIPSPSVSPKQESVRGERNAKSIETLCRRLRNDLPFERINDQDERFAPIYGGSVFLVEWDESVRTHTTVGEARVTCINPEDLVPQPNVYEIEDMQYLFVRFETTKDEIVRKYGVKPSVAEETESDEYTHDDGYTATVYVCYYKDEDDKVCEYVWSGDTELRDISDLYARRRKVCRICGEREGACHCEKPRYTTVTADFEEVITPITLSDGSVIPTEVPAFRDGLPVTEARQVQLKTPDGQMVFNNADGIATPVFETVQVPVMEPTRLPYYSPSVFPIVIRKNTSRERSLFGQSDCDVIRPQQQAINKIESRIQQKLLRAAVTPVMPEDARITADSSIFEQVIRLGPGESASQYGLIDTTPNISADISQSERHYDHAKRILGISDSFQGQYDPSAQSGKAKQLQINQAAGRLDSKRRMKNAAYADIDKIFFQLYLAYADEPRPAVLIDANGTRHNIEFNRYDFLVRDEAGEWYYDDRYLFSTDATIDIEDSRVTLWEENLKAFQMGAYGNPQDPSTLLIYWRNMERAHYPYARENVERLEAQIAQQMAAMQARAEAAEGELAKHEQYEQYLMNEIAGGQQNV